MSISPEYESSAWSRHSWTTGHGRRSGFSQECVSFVVGLFLHSSRLSQTKKAAPVGVNKRNGNEESERERERAASMTLTLRRVIWRLLQAALSPRRAIPQSKPKYCTVRHLFLGVQMLVGC
jgi:hypothetical protein